jgi:hypothetical protein
MVLRSLSYLREAALILEFSSAKHKLDLNNQTIPSKHILKNLSVGIVFIGTIDL